MLNIKNLKASVGDVEILKGIDYQLNRGSSTQLWGQMVLVNQLFAM